MSVSMLESQNRNISSNIKQINGIIKQRDFEMQIIQEKFGKEKLKVNKADETFTKLIQAFNIQVDNSKTLLMNNLESIRTNFDEYSKLSLNSNISNYYGIMLGIVSNYKNIMFKILSLTSFS